MRRSLILELLFTYFFEKSTVFLRCESRRFGLHSGGSGWFLLSRKKKPKHASFSLLKLDEIEIFLKALGIVLQLL